MISSILSVDLKSTSIDSLFVDSKIASFCLIYKEEFSVFPKSQM